MPSTNTACAPISVEKKYNNWVKAQLGVHFTRNGIEPFVCTELQEFQLKCLNDIRFNNELSRETLCSSCCTENVVKCPTLYICNVSNGKCSYHRNSATRYNPAGCPNKICHHIKKDIQDVHKYHHPSYKNTDASLWCSSPWEIAKCFMPPDGYTDKKSAEETDFNGIVSVIINHKGFQLKTCEDLNNKNNIFQQARNIGKSVRFSPNLEVEHEDLHKYFEVFKTLLSDTGYLATDVHAQNAKQKILELENDTFVINEDDVRTAFVDVSRTMQDKLKIKMSEKYYMITLDMIKRRKRDLEFLHLQAEIPKNGRKRIHKKEEQTQTKRRKDVNKCEEHIQGKECKERRVSDEMEEISITTLYSRVRINKESKDLAARKKFSKRLVNHYRYGVLKTGARESFKGLHEKMRIRLFPTVLSLNKEKGLSWNTSTHQNLWLFTKDIFRKVQNDRQLITISGSQDNIEKACVDMLNTWAFSIEDEENFSDIEEANKDYDAVLIIKRIRESVNYTEFDSLLYDSVADDLKCTPDEIKRELSCCRKCLVLLGRKVPLTALNAAFKSRFQIIHFTNNNGDEILPNNDMFFENGSRFVLFSMKRKEVLDRSDGHDMEKWISSRFTIEEANNKHVFCFDNIKGPAKLNLVNFPHIESIQFYNCDLTFCVAHAAKDVILYGQSIQALDKYLAKSHKLENVCLDYQNETEESKEICSPLNEMFIQKISSMEIPLQLQTLELKDFSVGTHKQIKFGISCSAVMKLREDTTLRSLQDMCSSLLGPLLERFDLTKEDCDLERTQFAKKVILNIVCHQLLKSDDGNIYEAYASDHHDTIESDTGISIFCFRKMENYETNKYFKGFRLFQKTRRSISTESIIAEKTVHNKDKTYIKTLSNTIKTNAQILFRDHSNLEAVCGSFVRSTSSGIKLLKPCIVLYCQWKGVIPFGEKEFPKELKEPSHDTTFLTDVREGFFMFGPCGQTLTMDAQVWNQELAMGCSIGPSNIGVSATIGPFLNICDTNKTCFLTVRHMFQPFDIPDKDLLNTKIVQPADGDELVGSSGTCNSRSPEERCCGTLIYSHFNELIDAAVVEIDPNRMPKRGNFVSITKTALNFSGFSKSNFPSFDDGSMTDARCFTVQNHATERVIKFGKQTGLTRGSFDLHDMAVKVKDEIKLSFHYDGKMQEKIMKNQLQIGSYSHDPFFLQGDSGSAVFLVDKQNKLHCIGMAIGFLPDMKCVVTPIQTILETLNQNSNGLRFELKKFQFEEMSS